MTDIELLEKKYEKACQIIGEKVTTCPKGRDCLSGINKEKDCSKCWQFYIDKKCREEIMDDK